METVARALTWPVSLRTAKVNDSASPAVVLGVKVRDLNVTRAFHVITHRDRSRSPLAQAFLTFVESQPTERPS